MSGTIVLGYIPSPQGVAAFEHAKEEAARRQATLLVVNTGQDGDFTGPSFATPQDLDAIDAELSAAGIPHEVSQPSASVLPAEEILRLAAERSADLIVIGLRHRSPVGKLLLGSTAQQVLLNAPCPVLSVQAPRR
jgi:nucleotide-binding universal stress UspA family protein